MKLKSTLISSLFLAIISWFVLVPPPGSIGPYLNNVFPDSPPGADSKWGIEDPLDGALLDAPIDLIEIPNSEDLFILSKVGSVIRTNFETKSIETVLDLRDNVFEKSDAGATSFVLHPKFGDLNYPDKQLIFIFYKFNPDPDEWVFSGGGMNRLSKFRWDAEDEVFIRESEEILISQFDRSAWHDGGGLFFDDAGLLYLALGDEGQDQYQNDSNQRRDKGLFSGMLRIDVDNDIDRSHPIRRQPKPNAQAPEEWGQTYTQGYMIPNDNPWLSPDGSALEEYVMMGLRSPYSTSFDRETGDIWIADVGSDVAEEISMAQIGDNLQWPYMEGFEPSERHDRPEIILGEEVQPFIIFPREEINCIIGGGIYRSTKYSELNEKYIFANFFPAKLYTVTNNGISNEPTYELLASNLDLASVGLENGSRISNIYLHSDGNIYVSFILNDELDHGKVIRLKRQTAIADPPNKLSELNVFSDLSNLQVEEGILPYNVNAPLWSDGAIKKRWLAVPNDGVFDSPSEQINFKSQENWSFPEGTVFIKHFDLPTDGEEKIAKLETRFFIIGKGGRGYGLTYKWNDEGTEAFLLGGGSTKDFDIFIDGEFAYTQTWEYPSRDQCMSCHNQNAEFVLGVRTHQLNKDQEYIHLGKSMNQLDYFNQSDMFSSNIGTSNTYQRSYHIENQNINLETRIRSYLDANCSYCHQSGGIPDINLDFRYNDQNSLKTYLDFPTASHASTSGRPIIKLGSHEESELWVRDNSEGTNKMPPLGRTMVDQIYVDSLAKWIDNIDPNSIPTQHDLMVFPNPTVDWIAARFDDDWEAPFKVYITSASGRQIREFTTDDEVIYLDLSSTPSGTYFFTAVSNDIKQTRKFVIR